MRWLALAGVLALGGAGCSFISVRGPAGTPRSREVKCTDHYGAPVGDAFVGTLATTAAAVSLRYFGGIGQSSPAGGGSDGSSGTTWAGVTFSILAVAVALVASSAYGFVQVGRCNAAKDAAERMRARQAWLPPPLPGPGPP
jgi:hypothetical protein